MSVFDLKTGETAEIVRTEFSGGAGARLASLGIIAGKRVTVLAFSLFKSSVLIGCGAVRLGIRKSLARLIEVKLCE